MISRRIGLTPNQESKLVFAPMSTHKIVFITLLLLLLFYLFLVFHWLTIAAARARVRP